MIKKKGTLRLSHRLPADVDEVARRRRLAGDVAFEISVDLMLQFATKGLRHQLLKALQTMRVVGQTEFTKEHKQSTGVSQTSLK